MTKEELLDIVVEAYDSAFDKGTDQFLAMVEEVRTIRNRFKSINNKVNFYDDRDYNEFLKYLVESLKKS